MNHLNLEMNMNGCQAQELIQGLNFDGLFTMDRGLKRNTRKRGMLSITSYEPVDVIASPVIRVYLLLQVQPGNHSKDIVPGITGPLKQQKRPLQAQSARHKAFERVLLGVLNSKT